MRPDYDIRIQRDKRGSPVAMYFIPTDRRAYFLAANPCKLCRGMGRYKGCTGHWINCSCEAATVAQSNIFLARKAFARLSRPMQIAWLVRFNAELWAHHNGFEPKTLRHLCGLCSAALARALKREGYEPLIAEGEVGSWHHAWVVFRGRILDLTYTQFDSNAPKVFTAPKDDQRFGKVTYFSGLALKGWLRETGGNIRALTTFN